MLDKNKVNSTICPYFGDERCSLSRKVISEWKCTTEKKIEAAIESGCASLLSGHPCKSCLETISAHLICNLDIILLSFFHFDQAYVIK